MHLLQPHQRQPSQVGEGHLARSRRSGRAPASRLATSQTQHGGAWQLPDQDARCVCEPRGHRPSQCDQPPLQDPCAPRALALPPRSEGLVESRVKSLVFTGPLTLSRRYGRYDQRVSYLETPRWKKYFPRLKNSLSSIHLRTVSLRPLPSRPQVWLVAKVGPGRSQTGATRVRPGHVQSCSHMQHPLAELLGHSSTRPEAAPMQRAQLLQAIMPPCWPCPSRCPRGPGTGRQPCCW